MSDIVSDSTFAQVTSFFQSLIDPLIALVLMNGMSGNVVTFSPCELPELYATQKQVIQWPLNGLIPSQHKLPSQNGSYIDNKSFIWATYSTIRRTMLNVTTPLLFSNYCFLFMTFYPFRETQFSAIIIIPYSIIMIL